MRPPLTPDEPGRAAPRRVDRALVGLACLAGLGLLAAGLFMAQPRVAPQLQEGSEEAARDPFEQTSLPATRPPLDAPEGPPLPDEVPAGALTPPPVDLPEGIPYGMGAIPEAEWRPFTVEGVLVDISGNPLAGVPVSLQTLWFDEEPVDPAVCGVLRQGWLNAQRTTVMKALGRTDSRGRFTLPAPRPGLLHVTAAPPEFALVTHRIGAQLEDVSGVHVVARRAPFQGTLRFRATSGKLPVGAPVNVTSYTPDGLSRFIGSYRLSTKGEIPLAGVARGTVLAIDLVGDVRRHFLLRWTGQRVLDIELPVEERGPRLVIVKPPRLNLRR